MNILVIKPSSLGDIIHGLQVMQQVHVALPSVQIDWVVRDCFSKMIYMVPWIRHVYIFHRHGWLLKFINLIKEIRCQHYDYIFDMQGLARSGVITYCSHGENKIGRYDSREFSRVSYHDCINFPKQTSPHAIDILCQFLPVLDIDPKVIAPLQLLPSPSNNILSFINSRNNDRKMIILFPESRRKEKEWHAFPELTDALAKHCDMSDVIILGQRKFSILSHYSNIYDFSGTTTLDDIVYLIQHATMVVTNDSAPLHIASALNKTTVALFGPTDPSKYGPYGQSWPAHRIISANNKNINTISFDTVFNACLEKYQECISEGNQANA